jgi:uncharacterized repeat protein (TIGR01451 family)
VKVNGRLSGKSLVWIRVLSVGTLLLLVGYIVLGLSSRPRPSGQSPMEASAIPPAAFFPTASPTVGSTLGSRVPDSSGRRARDPRAAFVNLPIMFEPNRGQSNPNVKFLARGAGYSLFLDAEGAVLASQRARNSSHPGSGANVLRMKLAGANRSAFVSGEEQLPGKSNYFIGSDPAKWHRDIPQFARVRYENVYPGINLVFYGNQGQLEYDFQVAPGADPARPELEFDSSTKLQLEGGDLVLHGEGDAVRLHAPHVYQRLDSREQSVEGHFALRAANRVGFEVGRYDHNRELIIDPTLTYSTYFGGSGSESNASVAVDTAGNVYLVGTTDSAVNSFPQPAAGSPTQLGVAPHIFVAKLNPQGGSKGVEYLTFLGGSGTDTSVGIAVDGGGNAFIAGNTTAAGFPTTPTAYQTAPAAKIIQCTSACRSVFVTVLNSTGSALNYSSYLSGNGDDIASGMTIDNRNHLFVTGTTTSKDAASLTDAFPAAMPPTANEPPFQISSGALTQFFVTKVNTASFGVPSISYSTYFGGETPSNAIAVGGGIALDSTGNIYFTGTTNFLFTGVGRPVDFPILNAYQPCLDQAPPTTIVNPVTCTYTTTPTATDAFIAKLNPNVAAAQLLWSTYFGGSLDDVGTGIALDSGAANIYITGTTNSPDITIPTSIAAYQKCLDTPVNPTTCTPPPPPAPTDAYVARLNNPTTGNTSLTYFSYLGGTGNDTGSAITVDTASGALLTGSTNSTDFPIFPTTCAVPPCVIQSHLAGAQNAFLAHINTTTTTVTSVGEYVTYFGGNGTDNGTSIALDLGLNAYIAGDTTSAVNFPLAGFVQSTLNGPKDAFVAKLGTAAVLTVCGRLSTQTTCPPTGPTPVVSAGSPATFTYTITNNGPDLATGITFTDSLAGLPVAFNSASVPTGVCTQSTGNSLPVECSIPSLQSGSTVAVTVILTPTSSGASGQFSFSGGAVTVSWGNPLSIKTAATVSVQASDFQVTVSPSNQTVSAGQTAIYTVALTPQGGLYGGSISLTCSANVPSQAACNFTTTPVTIPSISPVTSTLNLTTTARPVTTATAPLRGPLYAIWLGLPGIALLGIGAGEGNRRGKILALLLCMLFALLLLQPGCSSKSTTTAVGGTPAGTYTITLTATSGTATTHNYPFTLTVN